LYLPPASQPVNELFNFFFNTAFTLYGSSNDKKPENDRRSHALGPGLPA